MTSFKDRERGFEDKYNYDKENEFRIKSRAVYKLGLWAAEKLGMTGDDAKCYADSVIDADFQEPGVEDIFRKIMSDFQSKNIEIDHELIATTYNEKLTAEKNLAIAG